MIHTVKMPDIGEGVVEGEIIEWLIQVGQEVKQDQPVVIVMTDKATVELPAPAPGKLVRQYFQPGQMAQRDQPLYDLETEQELPTITAESLTTAPAAPIPIKKEQSGILALPVIRKMARDLGIDLSRVKGSGPDGRILLEDLHRPETKALEGDQTMPLVGIRHQMAIKMKESHDLIPHFSYFEQADATRLIQLKERLKKEASQEGVSMTYMPLLIRALSLTLRQYPQVNSSYDASTNQLILHQAHNIGIATSTPQGLIVPVLKGVQNMTLPDLIRQFEGLKQKVQSGKWLPSDMREATISISNYGVLSGGGLFATPIIHWPQVAILALAKIQKQPCVKHGEVVACDLLNLSWSFDHRVIDGELAALFSHHFCSLIQNPAVLL
jgi:pyruvate/2-oxoglutarate dehydrogenase complex dihydrolipoamide acyltransferase (E2) component